MSFQKPTGRSDIAYLPFDPASYHNHLGLIATATDSDLTVSTALHIRLATEHYTSQL
ncbi:hypothetical protein CROQUDRAFT_657009, partial [Cronartium quercuum f. sp. fusiforme G11]